MVSRLSGDGPFPSASDPEELLYKELRQRISEQDFDTWFKHTPCRFHPPDAFVLTAKNGFQKTWMVKHFRELLRNCARVLFDVEAHIEIEVQGPAGPEGSGGGERRSSRPEARAPAALHDKVPPARRPHASIPLPAGGVAPRAFSSAETEGHRESQPPRTSPGKVFNPSFTFETFVTGPANRVALAAAMAVAEHPAKSYNPLYIHGATGVGKTHLLHAICHRILDCTRLKVIYLASEDFLSRFLAALADSNLDSFRAFCKSADILVIDDVQFLAAKQRTQEELCHTLTTLMKEQKQIIVSGSHSPRGTTGINQRLVSQFRWGLIVPVEPPDFELRVAILMRKARQRHQELPIDVAEFLATHVGKDVRELEGALARLLNIAGFRSSPLDLEAARLALHETLQTQGTQPAVSIAQIIKALTDYYHVKPKELLSACKVRSVVLARHVGMYLARELLQLSLAEIGNQFGGRDHTTVLYAHQRIEKLRRSNPMLQSDLETLQTRLSLETRAP